MFINFSYESFKSLNQKSIYFRKYQSKRIKMSTPAARILKKKHFRVKHQKVKLFRANEPMLSVLMWGINHTINELSHCAVPGLLLPDHFKANSKIKVDYHLFNK